MALYQCKGWAVGLFVVAIGLGGCGADESTSEGGTGKASVVAEQAAAQPTRGPESTKSENWRYVVNNAIREADRYAADHNPKATALGHNTVEFHEQFGGEFIGRHLLRIVNEHSGDVSFFMLLPLFDEHASSQALDDEVPLWKVVLAKHNGIEF